MKEAVQHLDKQALMVRIQAVRLLLIPHEWDLIWKEILRMSYNHKMREWL